MTEIQKAFLNYHDEIKLGTYDENQVLRDKRDLLIDELKKLLTDEKVPNTDKKLTFSKIDQGSYAMHTGIKPLNGDYDIDVGLIFDVKLDEYDSKSLKKLIRDKLNKQNKRTVTYNRPCISVEYASGYHVDLPIYAKDGEELVIAWGKEYSSDHTWYESDPEGLKQWVNNISSISDEKKQFRRCVRYLKRWKNKHFNQSGNIAPPSIGLTIQARDAFYYDADDDLGCLISMAKEMKNSFCDIWDDKTCTFKKSVEVNLPVKPWKNVYHKMTLNQLNNFYNKIDELVEALEKAQSEDSLKEASKILDKIFGDFPSLEDTKASSQAGYVTTGFNA